MANSDTDMDALARSAMRNSRASQEHALTFESTLSPSSLPEVNESL